MHHVPFPLAPDGGIPLIRIKVYALFSPPNGFFSSFGLASFYVSGPAFTRIFPTRFFFQIIFFQMWGTELHRKKSGLCRKPPVFSFLSLGQTF